MTPKSTLLTRGGLARRVGISGEAIRFYENRKLLPDPERSAAGYRQYPPESVKRVQFIKRAQTLGFTLEEIAELLQLRANPRGSSRAVKAVAMEKLAVIDTKIRDLKRMKKSLGALVNSCDGQGPRHDCPILTAIEEEAR